MSRRPSGLSLVELLAAMALLGTLGTLLVQLMRNSFDLYHAGERSGQHLASASTVLGLLEDDLSNVHTGAGGRFVVSVSRVGGGPQSMIRLVRALPQGEAIHPVLRSAGARPAPVPTPESQPTDGSARGLPEIGKPEAAWTGGDPGIGAREQLAPPAGLMEVCWALTQEDVDPPGMLTLWRGVRTPALAQGGFFGDEAPMVADPAWIRRNLSPVVTGVLLLRVYAGDAIPNIEDEAAMLDAPPNASGRETWDSTRALLPPEQFGFARGPASLADERDDLFPRRLGITLTIGTPGRPEARLVRPLRPGERELVVDEPGRLPRLGDRDRLVSVGGEWCEVDDVITGGARVARGRRRSEVGEHAPGTSVNVGKTYRLTVRPPTGRADYTETTR